MEPKFLIKHLSKLSMLDIKTYKPFVNFRAVKKVILFNLLVLCLRKLRVRKVI